MVNKRLLIQNLLSHHDEGTIYDKKLKLDLLALEGKQKLLKHICAFNNSNQGHDSFLIVGVANNGAIIGTEYIDDSNIQNLVYEYFDNPPRVKYENISFPEISRENSIGLLTISSSGISSFKKAIGKISKGTKYHRRGSESIQSDDSLLTYPSNKKLVDDLYKMSSLLLKDMLDGVFDFFKTWELGYNPNYLIFQEQFVVCWSGWKEEEYYTEVDIQIINEARRFFFPAGKYVTLSISQNSIEIITYINLGYEGNFGYFPLERNLLSFHNNGNYSFEKDFIFSPPIFSKDDLVKLYKDSNEIARKLALGRKLTEQELMFMEGISNYYFICYLNGIFEAKKKFYDTESFVDGSSAEWYFACKGVLEQYEGTKTKG